MTSMESDSMMEDISFSSDMEGVSDENGEWIIVNQEMESLDLNGGVCSDNLQSYTFVTPNT